MEDARWTRLIEEHQRNAARLASAEVPPPSLTGMVLGFLVPWLAVALAWANPTSAFPVIAALVLFVPVGGLACLFVERWRTMTLGLVLGSLTATLAVQQLFL
jgi:hypothetical protein